MLRFAKFEYDNKLDEPVRGICDALNSLPGITTTSSCCGHGKQAPMIIFDVDGPVGLSFLVRCMDRRYFEYGARVRLDLCISDSPPNHVYYCLETIGRYWGNNGVSFEGEDGYKILDALVANMEEHLNLPVWTQYYDLGAFALETTVQ